MMAFSANRNLTLALHKPIRFLGLAYEIACAVA